MFLLLYLVFRIGFFHEVHQKGQENANDHDGKTDHQADHIGRGFGDNEEDQDGRNEEADVVTEHDSRSRPLGQVAEYRPQVPLPPGKTANTDEAAQQDAEGELGGKKQQADRHKQDQNDPVEYFKLSLEGVFFYGIHASNS